MILQSDISLITAFIIQNDCGSSLKKVSRKNTVTSYCLYLHLFRMMSSNRIKPIVSEANIPIEANKDINIENDISLHPPYENGMCSQKSSNI